MSHERVKRGQKKPTNNRPKRSRAQVNDWRNSSTGLVGKIFGDRENAALYFSSALALVSLALLGTVIVVDDSLRPEVAKTIGGIAFAAMGFIGGLLSK